MILTPAQYEQVQHEAMADYPKEAVWYVTSSGLRKVANISETPEQSFLVSSTDTAQAFKDGLIAVIHSHPDGPAYPSLSDMKSQIATGVAFGIICCTSDSAGDYCEWGGKADIADLKNRPFRHGITDCYGLIRDYFMIQYNITIPDFPRRWDWWNEGDNLYENHMQEMGFIRIGLDDLRAGDVVCASIRSSVPNHGGVYLGDEVILHHLTAQKPYDTTRRPSQEPIHRWLKYIGHVYRHRELMNND